LLKLLPRWLLGQQAGWWGNYRPPRLQQTALSSWLQLQVQVVVRPHKLLWQLQTRLTNWQLKLWQLRLLQQLLSSWRHLPQPVGLASLVGCKTARVLLRRRHVVSWQK
jgi:hypothetical protein